MFCLVGHSFSQENPNFVNFDNFDNQGFGDFSNFDGLQSVFANAGFDETGFGNAGIGFPAGNQGFNLGVGQGLNTDIRIQPNPVGVAGFSAGPASATFPIGGVGFGNAGPIVNLESAGTVFNNVQLPVGGPGLGNIPASTISGGFIPSQRAPVTHTQSFSQNVRDRPVQVSVPQPVPVPVNRPVPVPVPQPVPVEIVHRVPVPVPRPYPVPVNRPYPVAVNRPIPVPVPQPYQVSVPRPIAIPHPVPHPVHIPEPHPHVVYKVGRPTYYQAGYGFHKPSFGHGYGHHSAHYHSDHHQPHQHHNPHDHHHSHGHHDLSGY